MGSEYKFFTKIKSTGTMLYIKIPNDMKEFIKKGDFIDVIVKKRKESKS